MAARIAALPSLPAERDPTGQVSGLTSQRAAFLPA